MRDRIKVLFLASDPFRLRAAPRLDAEMRAVHRAVRRGGAGGLMELAAHFVPRTRDLQDALLWHDPQIVHFAGHGDDSGVHYLGDAHGRRRPVGKEALGTLFGALSEWIKVVIVNGGDTLPTVEILGKSVDYAIGMNRPLGDASAIAFAGAFYGALAMGRTVRSAFALAVHQLEIEGNAGALAPVLRIRAGVDPAVPLVPRPPDVPPLAPDRRRGGAADVRPMDVFSPVGSRRAPRGPAGPGDPKGEDRFGDSFVYRFTFQAGRTH